MAQQLQAQTALAEAPALISRVPVSWLTGPVTPAPGRWTPVASRAPGFMCTNAPTHLKNLQRKDDVCFTALEAGSPHNTVSVLWEGHDEQRGRPVWSQTQALTTTCCKSSGTRRAVSVLATSSSLNNPRTSNWVTSLQGSTTLRPRSHLQKVRALFIASLVSFPGPTAQRSQPFIFTLRTKLPTHSRHPHISTNESGNVLSSSTV